MGSTSVVDLMQIVKLDGSEHADKTFKKANFGKLKYEAQKFYNWT
jgi:hypothetical protein